MTTIPTTASSLTLQRRATAFDALAAPAAVLDADGVIVEVNDAWHLFERLEGAVDGTTGVGVNYLDVCERSRAAEPLAGQVADALRQILAGERTQADIEYPCHSPFGDRWFVAQATAATVDDGAGVVVVHNDVTARKLLQAGMLSHLRVDVATGLPDGPAARNHIAMLCDAVVASEPSTAVLMMLGGIDLVADRMGPAAADEAVAHLAARARRSMRAGDALFRLGPGELLLVVTGVDEMTAAAMADRLLGALTAPLQVGSTEVSVAALVGAAPIARGGEVDAVLAAARDAAFGRGATSMTVPVPRPIADPPTPTLDDRVPTPPEFPAPSLADPQQTVEPLPATLDEALTMLVSERGRAQLLERRLALLLNKTSEVVLVIGPDRVINYASSSIRSVLGFEPADLTGTPGAAFTHPDDQPVFREALAEAILDPEVVHPPVVVRARHVDGSWRWGEVSIASLLHDPAVAGVVLNIRDITERFDTVRELQKEKATRDAIVARSRDLVIFFESDGTIVWVSPAARPLLGVDPDDLLGRNGFDMVHPDDRDRVILEFASNMGSGGEHLSVEFRAELPDGTIRWIEEVATDLTDDPAVGVVVGNLRDITDRKVAEERVHFQARLLQAVGQPVIGTDNLGCVSYWNEAATETYGWTADEARGERLESLLRPADGWHEQVESIRAHLYDRRPWTGEIELFRKDGTVIPVEVSNTPVFDDAHRHAGTIGVSFDLTERRRGEELAARLSAIVESSSDAILSADLDGAITTWNSGAAQLYGYAEAEIVGRPLTVLAPEDRADELGDMLAAIRRGESVGTRQTRGRGAGGDCFHASFSMSPIRDRSGAVIGSSAIVRDITELVELHERIAVDHRRLADAQASAHLGSFEIDLETGAITRSAQMCRILGVDEASNKPLSLDHIHPDDRQMVEEGLEEAIAHGGEVERTHRIVRPDGEVRWVVSRSNLVHDPQCEVISGTVLDITERKHAELAIEHLAFHDPLTGLANRTLLSRRLADALAADDAGPPTVVALLDVDQFKVINDSLGHAVGDAVLQAITGRLEGVLGAGETLARFGGDEFAVIAGRAGDAGADTAPDAADTAERLGARLLAAFDSPIAVGHREFQLSVSIGLTLGRPGDTVDATLRDADVAMYHAKASGRNRFERFDEQLRVATHRRLELESALRVAVECEQFEIAFQPVLELGSGHPAGFEALLRWDHPDHGPVGPDEFIPIAEDTGLILPMGEWVLDRSLAELARWRREGRVDGDTWVAVNLSARQLEHPDLVSRVAEAIVRADLDPELLHLEITESVLMDSIERSHETVVALRSLGIRLSIDDFGTGYSSLSYLRRLPIDTLKIDRTFIDGLGADTHDSSIVQAIISLAGSLHMNVVAEGVETETQQAILRGLGCDFGQGFLWSRPVPADDALAWAASCRQQASPPG